MTPQPLTYARLLEQQAYLVSTKQVQKQTAANRATALRAFLRANRVDVNDVIGDEMRSLFQDCLERLIDELREAGRAQRDLTNTASALTPWKQMVVEWDTNRASEQERPTPFQMQLRALVGEFTIKRVAKQCAVPYDMLLGWFQGKRPRTASVRYIARIESYFGMDRGSLSALTGLSHMPRLYPSLGEPTPIEYRTTLGARTKDSYWIRPLVDSPLRKQWFDYVEYKTTPVPILERSSKGQWRFSPLPMASNTSSNWFRFHKGQEVPSGSAVWSKVASYLGFLGLPSERGGPGIPQEQLQTLAWFVVPEMLQRHIDWKRARAGGKLSGAFPELLGWIQSLVRAEVGYFTQSPWLRDTLPEEFRTDDWLTMCAKQMKYCQRLTLSMRGSIEVSRDPFAPISHIIDLDEPMEAVADMVQRLRADRPVCNQYAEAIWGRDILLIKLLASNPLRVRQFSHLRWKPDNTGNLRIPLIADTHSKLIADSVPGDRGHPG